ncbi:MAG TPA: hypothetical protein VHX62_11820 [Solirubrobacteraceae bacterium]|jgi:hypothetical protein|nr:hypothetical protein [Solirubrobacteraceae bacterium]
MTADTRPITADTRPTERELDSRVSDGIEVRLLWSRHDGRAWVAVSDPKTGDSFRIPVRAGERALDVFYHPFAYAAFHGVGTRPAQPWASARAGDRWAARHAG